MNTKISHSVNGSVWMKAAEINRESSISFTDAKDQVWKPLHRIVMAEVWLSISDELLNPFEL